MSLVQNFAVFPSLYFEAKHAREENVSQDILERKNSSLDNEKKLKKWNNTFFGLEYHYTLSWPILP